MKSLNHRIVCWAAVLLAGASCWVFPARGADEQPGWLSGTGERVPSDPNMADAPLAPALLRAKAEGSMMRLSAPDEQTPEIQELARNLQHNPKLIFEFVRNKIEYVPYYGFLKGATQTWLDRSGNDADQAALLVALLRASGISASYNIGSNSIPTVGEQDITAAKWFDVDDNLVAVDQMIFQNGIPGGVDMYSGRTKMSRIWVKAVIDDVDCQLDPAYKSHTRPIGVDLASAMGYVRSTLLTAAGGVSGSTYVTGLNETTTLAQAFATLSTNLVQYFRTTCPNAALEEILGESQIIPVEYDTLPTSLPDMVLYNSWDTPPANLMHTVRLRHGLIDRTYSISEIAGKRLSITYTNDTNVDVPLSRKKGEPQVDFTPIPISDDEARPFAISTSSVAFAEQDGGSLSVSAQATPVPTEETNMVMDVPVPVSMVSEQGAEPELIFDPVTQWENPSIFGTGLTMPRNAESARPQPLGNTYSFDFGELLKPEKIQKSVWIYTRYSPNTINPLVIDCWLENNGSGAFSLPETHWRLQGRESATIRAWFTTGNQSTYGIKTAKLRVTGFWDTMQGDLLSFDDTFNLSGRAVPRPNVNFPGVNMGDKTLNHPEYGVVRFSNKGDVDVVISGISLAGVNPDRFSLYNGYQGVVVGKGKNLDILVLYKADMFGSHSTQVGVTFWCDVREWQTSCTLSAQTVPSLNTSGSVGADFGTRFIGSPVDGYCRLYNNGPATLTITSLGTNGSGASQFSSPGGTGSIGGGQYRDIPVRYLATARGRHEAALRINFTYEGLTWSMDLPLKGTTLSRPRAQLWLDDVLVDKESAAVSGTTENLIVTIDHPYAALSSTYGDRTVSFPLKRGATYALISDFGDCDAGELLNRRQRVLDGYRQSGVADSSRQVVTETLNIMGQMWMRQTALASRLLSRICKVKHIHHHRFGLMAQEEGYYVDIRAQFSADIARDGLAPRVDSYFRASGLLSSALEHGVLEQLQGTNKPAVSTVRLLQLANKTGLKIFYANAANWASIRPSLLNYSAADLVSFTNRVTQGQTLILPENAKIRLNEWEGKGYVAYGPVPEGYTELAMIIGGDYVINGGYNSTMENVNIPTLYYNISANFFGLVESQVHLANDPVDIATGNFLIDREDLSLGSGVPPRGMSFKRSYNSGQINLRSALGHGWNHNLDIQAQVRSEGASGLGWRSPVDAVAMLVASVVAKDLVTNQNNAKGWVTAALASKWAIDQLNENAVSIQMGGKNAEFIKLPDGSYNPPPGVTTELTLNRPLQFGWASALPAPADDDGDGTTDLAVVGGTNWYIAGFNPFPLGFGFSGGILAPADYDGDGTDDLASINPATWNWRIRYSGNSTVADIQFGFGGCLPVPGDYNGNGLTELAVVNTNNNAFDWYIPGHQPYPHQFGFGGCLPVPGDYNGNGATEMAVVKTNTFDWYIAGHEPYPHQFGWAGCIPVPDDYDGDGHTDIAVFSPTKATLYVLGSLKGFWTVPMERGDGMVVHGDFDGDGRAQVATYQPNGGLWRIQGANDGLFHLQERFGVEYVFNRDRRIALWEDADHNTMNFDYNAKSNLQAVTDSSGRKLTLTYDSTGTNLASVADSTGRSVGYAVVNGNLTSVTDAKGFSWKCTYDAKHRCLALRDPLGTQTISNLYNPVSGQVGSQINGAGQIWRMYVVPRFRGAEISTNPFYQSTTRFFDDKGRQVSRVDTLGNAQRTTYDGQNHVASETDARGNQTIYQYDKNHNCTNIVDALGHAKVFAYDWWNRLVYTRDALWHVARFGYDAEHHLTNAVDALLNETTTTYTPDGLPHVMTGPRGETTTYTYDRYGNPATIARLNGGTETLVWTARGDLSTRTDANAQKTTYFYDERRQLIAVRDPLGRTATNVYNAAGLLVTNVDRRGAVTATTYTPTYKVASIRFPDGGVVSNSYDEADRLIHVRDPLGGISTNVYDVAGRLIRVVDPLGNFVRNFLDPDGNLVAVHDNAGLRVTNRYDELNRLYRSTDARGHSVSNQFNEVGWRVSSWDRERKLTQYRYDALGRVTNEIRGGLAHRFEYDESGNLVAYVNPDGAAIRFGYDLMNRKIAETNALLKVTRYLYDPVGNLVWKSRANGYATYDYDSVNQMVQMSSTWGDATLFGYDPNGNLTNMVDRFGTTRQAYDAMNRLLRTQDPFGQVVSNAYDKAGQRTKLVYPDQKIQWFYYDAGGHLTNSKAWDFGLANFSYVYDARGNETGSMLPGGLVATNLYNAANHRVAWSVAKDGVDLLARSNVRNALGFKQTETIAAGVDAMAGPDEQTRGHNAADQIATFAQTGPDAAIVPSYDAAGNVTQQVLSVGGQTFAVRYEYGLDNQLLSVVRTRNAPDGTTATSAVTQLEFDGLGLLTRFTKNGVVRRLVRDPADPLARPLAEMDGEGNVLRRYLWANGKLQAQVNADGTIRVAISDELGNVRGFANAYGALTDQFAYQPYGRLIAHTGQTQTPFAFMGDYGVWNAGNGLYLTRHRAYDANLMRFLQPDPLGLAGGRNFYAYAIGNPLAFLDPFGLCADAYYDRETSIGPRMDYHDVMSMGLAYTEGMLERQAFMNRWENTFMVGNAVHSVDAFQNGQYIRGAVNAVGVGLDAAFVVYGASALGSAASRSVANDTANRAFWMGVEDGLAAAEADGANILRLSPAAQSALDAGEYSLMQAESTAWAAGATGDAYVYVGNGAGRTFWNYELPELLNNVNHGTVNSINYIFLPR